MPPNPFNPTDEERDAIIAASNQVRRLTPQEIMQQVPTAALAGIVERIAKIEWVVLAKDGKSCLKNPAMNEPFHTNNKKYAELVAKEAGGVAVTYAEALRVITERNKPND